MAQDKASKPGTRFRFLHAQSYQGSRSVTPPCLNGFEFKTLDDEDFMYLIGLCPLGLVEPGYLHS